MQTDDLVICWENTLVIAIQLNTLWQHRKASIEKELFSNVAVPLKRMVKKFEYPNYTTNVCIKT